jgi:serine/threonine protein kinase
MLDLALFHRNQQANVLVDDKRVVKIGDFGSSKVIDVEFYLSSSTLDANHWMPPEWFLSMSRIYGAYHHPRPSGDIWSFDCLFFEVSFDSRCQSASKKSALNYRYRSSEKNGRTITVIPKFTCRTDNIRQSRIPRKVLTRHSGSS